MMVLVLVNDWVGMWMGHVLQWVWLQGKDPFKVVRDEVLVRIWQKFGGIWKLIGANSTI